MLRNPLLSQITRSIFELDAVHGKLPAFPRNERRGRRFRSDRGTRGESEARTSRKYICDRSGRSSVDERFAGWKVSPSRAERMLERPSGGGTAGVVRWLARTRQAVHPFTRSLPPSPSPTTAPPRLRSAHVRVRYSRIHRHALVADLSSSPPSCRPPSRPFKLLRRHRSRSERERAALTKLPVFVLRGIAGYRTPRVNTIIDPLHFAPCANENLFL